MLETRKVRDMSSNPDPEFLPEKPEYRRTQAQQLAQIPGLHEKVLARVQRRITQRSIIEGGPTRELSGATKEYLEAGVRAVSKIQQQPDVLLAPIEEKGLESVILIALRPALLIQNDDFAEADEPWKEPLDTARQEIRIRVPSIGRIETVSGNQTQIIATGFVVGDGLVMTNRHVVELIADQYPNHPTKWKLRTSLSPQINFKGEYNLPQTRVFGFLDEPIHTHSTLDLGLLRIGGSAVPSKLKVSSSEPDLTASKNLYVVGYPESDNEKIIPDAVLKDIFAGHYGFKRLAPGELRNKFEPEGVFAHDCSTLGGNSGSCVVDLDSQMIIGLHYSGSYTKSNYAVSLWKLKSDSLLSEVGVDFD
jgi:glutamyl endopeptidase